ncbi:MAG: lipoyl synthase [Pseudomonadota bacterium]
MRLPDWLKNINKASDASHNLKKDLRAMGLHTVCEEARCPNLGECFKKGTATFMIMGNVCTRSCKFCAVNSGVPAPLDQSEPYKIAEQVLKLKLKHVVITSVTRDDLKDGGASCFALTIEEIKKGAPQTTIEVLTPDFGGRIKDLETVIQAGPYILNHNVETVVRLTPQIRDPKASYQLSINVLKMVSKLRCTKIKSGFMLGLGETKQEVKATIKDLKDAGCDIITIGQYLMPSKAAIPVKEYIHPQEFEEYAAYGRNIGVEHMFCGPLVRSSYMAEKIL